MASQNPGANSGQSSSVQIQPRKSTIADPLSPYFLHHSNSPGLVLVSQQLIGEAYASWSKAMTIALSVKNKLGFIDGTISRPTNANFLGP